MNEKNGESPKGLFLERSDGRTVTIDQAAKAFAKPEPVAECQHCGRLTGEKPEDKMMPYRASDWSVTSKVWRATQTQQILRQVVDRNSEGAEPSIDNVRFVKEMWLKHVVGWDGFMSADGPIPCSNEEKELLVEYHWEFAQNVIVAIGDKIKATSVGDEVVAKNSQRSGSTGSQIELSETATTAKPSAD